MATKANDDGLPVGPRFPSSWNYGAVEKALRDSASRGEKCIFEPKDGQVFQSLEEAYEFFNMYSWEVSFGIRHGRCRFNGDKMKTRQDLYCSCELSLENEAAAALEKMSNEVIMCSTKLFKDNMQCSPEFFS